ncbi:MAG: dipeptidase [Pyrinomonadaceae bacterium]
MTTQFLQAAAAISLILIGAAPALSQSKRSESEARALVRRVLKSSPIIDGHNDLFAWYHGCNYKKLTKCPQDISDYPIDKIQKGHTDIPRWRKGGVGGVQVNVYSETLSTFLDAYDLLYRLEKRYSKDLKVVGSSLEMHKAMVSGKIALLPMLEGSDRLEGKPSLLRTYYRLGLRTVTFTYTSGELGDGSDDAPKNNGVSALGKAMIKEMNDLGMIVDISHASTKTMNDVLDQTSVPVIFSHSNARAMCDVERNVPDDVLLRLKKNGGMIMVDMAPEHTSNVFARWMREGDNLYFSVKKQSPNDSKLLADTMKSWERANPQPRVTIAEVADHFDHVKRLIGVDHIGISGDYDGIEYTTDGLEDVSKFPDLLLELARRGWRKTELEKITGQNFLRVFERVEINRKG